MCPGLSQLPSQACPLTLQLQRADFVALSAHDIKHQDTSTGCGLGSGQNTPPTIPPQGHLGHFGEHKGWNSYIPFITFLPWGKGRQIGELVMESEEEREASCSSGL